MAAAKKAAEKAAPPAVKADIAEAEALMQGDHPAEPAEAADAPPAAPVLGVAITRRDAGTVTPRVGGVTYEWEAGAEVLVATYDAEFVLNVITNGNDEDAATARDITDPTDPLLPQAPKLAVVPEPTPVPEGPTFLTGTVADSEDGTEYVGPSLVKGSVAPVPADEVQEVGPAIIGKKAPGE